MTKQDDDKRYYQKHKKEIKKHIQNKYYKDINKSHNYNHLRYLKEKPKDIIILHNLKINGCAICNYNRCDWALDFHHVNPEDRLFKINMRSMRNNVERIANEVNKCILLCKNCHYEIHHNMIIKENEKMSKFNKGER